MANEPSVVPRDYLAGMRVSLSISESADLRRLGLSPLHIELVVAEIARAVLFAGGTLLYGGDLRREGFSSILLDEAGRFASEREGVEIHVPHFSHRVLSEGAIRDIRNRYGLAAKIVLLSDDGTPLAAGDVAGGSAASGLTSMRRALTDASNARLIVGGKLRDYEGVEPGVLEEARMTIEAGKPLYIAGGFGGASAAMAGLMGYIDHDCYPADYPLGSSDASVVTSLDSIQRVVEASGNAADGLDEEERSILAASHRPSDIAMMAVRGLARLRAAS